MISASPTRRPPPSTRTRANDASRTHAAVGVPALAESGYSRCARTGSRGSIPGYSAATSRRVPARRGSTRSARISCCARCRGRRTQDGLANIILGSVADTTGAGRVLLLTGEAENLSVRAIQDHGPHSIVEGPWTEVDYDEKIVVRVANSGVHWSRPIRSPRWSLAWADDCQAAIPAILRGTDKGARQDNWRDLRRTG